MLTPVFSVVDFRMQNCFGTGMKRLLGLSLLAGTMLYADTPAIGPARQLYDTGIRQTQDGKFEVARTTLQSLVNSYPKDPLALQAKGAIDATLLFEAGRDAGGILKVADQVKHFDAPQFAAAFERLQNAFQMQAASGTFWAAIAPSRSLSRPRHPRRPRPLCLTWITSGALWAR